ncbi:hypothetical protein PIB30_021693 [Stylosanthes scabra]|uniref:Pentatricopeptide repeat-containing protein n=1 Tax=Stylosanthes scabra TaxID=79078 RepID=A0ABU6Q9K1_9FABA|nr:hypothetical protein [Stylosanthes scabra]
MGHSFDRSLSSSERKFGVAVIIYGIRAFRPPRALELGNWVKGLMDADEFLLNPVLGTALIDLYAKCGSIAQAVDIFGMMKGKDRVLFNTIISGLAMNKHVRATCGIFGQMEKYGI